MPFVALAKKGYNKYMYYVYVLQGKNSKNYYVGFSENLKERIKTHKWHTVKTTKSDDFELIWYSGFKDKQKALTFEKYLKSGSGFAFRNKHLA